VEHIALSVKSAKIYFTAEICLLRMLGYLREARYFRGLKTINGSDYLSKNVYFHRLSGAKRRGIAKK